MKKAAFLIFILLFYQTSYAQNVLLPDWVKTKGSAVGGIAEGWGIDVDQEGNVYWPISVDSMGQGLDIVCYKFDANGNDLWPTPFFYGGIGTQHSYTCNAKDTALYIGGRYCAIHGFSCEMLLLKVNKNNKNLDWSKTQDFGNNGYDEVDGLVVRADGIYCGGWAQALQTGSYQIDMGLWKLNFDGSTAWTNYLGKTNTAEHLDGHFVVDDSTIYATGLWGGNGLFNLYNGHSFLGKFSKTDGTLKDSTLYGHQSSATLDIENALGMTSDGTYLYTTGYTILPNSTDWQIFIAKFDKNLNQIWYRTWGGTGNETARAIAVSGNKLFIGGRTESPACAPGGRADAVLIEYDTAGNFTSYKSWGDSLDNTFRDLVIHDNNIYLSGTSSFPNSQGDTAFIVKTSYTFPNSLSTERTAEANIKVFPNPSTNGLINIWIKNKRAQLYTIRLFNTLGQEVFKDAFNSNKFSFSVPNPNALFFYTISDKKRILTRGKLIAK